MKRKRIRIIAVILIGIMIINMFSGIPFVVKSAEAATGQMKDSRFQSTSYGVEDDRVIAHKLVLKDNESVIDLGIPDLLLVKQVIDKTRIQLHIYGVKGLIHTYELDADNEWVKRWEAAEDGHLDDLHSFARRLTFSKDHKHFDSELYKVMNPSTSDYDLINIENNKYYTFNADEVELIGLFDSMKNDTLDTKKKTDKISWVTYRVGKKYGIADTTGEKVTEAEYDEVGSKEKAVILTKEEVTEDGAINYKKTAVTVAGKLINLDNTREMAGPYYLKWTDDDEYSYINVETGQRIELGTYHGFYGAYGGSFVLLSQEFDDLSSADSWTYLKWYILTTSGKIINLNDKLGVDAIDCDAFCFNQGVYSGWTDYLQVTGYRVLSRINGDAKTEYAFRGFIDGEGNVVFGYDTNEDLEWEPYWWSGDYGIIRKSTSVNDYYDYKVIDRQGHDIYQYTAKSVVAQNLQNEYIYLSQDDSVITLNVKSKKVISNVKLKFEDDGRYQTYTWTTEEGDFIKVEDMDGRLGIMNGKNQKIYWMAKDAEGKTDSTSDIYVYENDKEVGHKKTMILLYSNNEQVALDANMSRIKGIPQLKSVVDDHVYGGYIFHHSGVVYDFCGNIILKNAYASNPNGYSNVYVFWEGADKWSYDSLVTISKTENGSSCMFDEKAALKWSYFNIQTGQMMFDYDYRSVSDFYNGLACVYQQGEYSDRLKVINEDGNILVNLYLGEQELEGFAWHWYGVPKDAMYSNGVILQNSDYYFYDFSNVTSDDIGSQESIETCYDNDSNIRAEKVETPDEKFRFSGLDCDFTLPEEIPVIGGGQVKIDFSKLPVSIERSGNVIRIGFGILQTENDESQNLFDSKTWDKLKTSAEKMQSNATNGIDAFNDAKDFGCVSMPMSKKVKTNVTGYVEGTLKNGKFTDNVTGRFVFQISASVKKQWQTAIVSVPVVFSASGEVSGTASFAVGLDWDNAKITLEGDQSIELTLPKVKLSAGVGIAYVANVSVYGQCENILEITSSQDSTNKEDARIRDYIDGEIGVSASLLLASYEKTLIKAKRKVVYDSKNGMITSNMQNKMAAPDEEDYKIQRDYVSDMTGWQTDNKESSGETADIQILQQNVYNDAKPQIVCTDNGIKVMTFITDVPERTTGNHTAVAYSIYDDTTDTWSKPLLVEDDGTADMLPQLATDGKAIYLTWVNTNRDDFTATTSVDEMAKTCEISVAEFDTAKKCFKNITRLTNDTYADINPSLVVEDGKAYVSWITNMDSDVIQLSGENIVKYASNVKGEWDSDIYETLDKPITDVQIGILQNDVAVAYLVDNDEDMTTTDDTKLFVGNVEGAAEEIIADKQGIQSVQFIKLEGQDVLGFSANDGFYYTQDTKMYTCLFEKEEQSNIRYNCISGKTSDLLLCSEAGEKGVDIRGYLYKDGKLSKEIPITNQDKYIKEPNGFYQDGEFYVVFTRSTADICDTEMMSSTDICTMHFKEYEDLKIDNLSVDEETVAPGQKGSLQVDVINQGLKEQKDFIIRVMNANEELGSYTYSELLPAGETKRIDIQFDIPEDFSAGTKISCIVEQKGDDNNTNNTLEQIVGKTNLSLDVIEKENAYDETEGILYVKNPSGYAANAVLKVYESGKNGKLLQEKSLGVIQPGEIQRIKYSADELDDLAAKSGTLYFEVACDEKETFLSDNYGYLMAGQGSDDDDDWDVSPSPTASSTPNPVSTPLPSATASNKPTKRPASTPFKVALGYASADWSDSCFGINEAAVLVDGNGTFTVSHKATSDSTDIKVLTVDTDMLFSDMTNNATWKITQFSVGGKVYPIGTQYSTNDEHGNFRFELRNLYSALDRKDEMLGTQIIPVKKGDIISVSFTITGMTSEASNAGKPSETPKPTDKQNPTITPTNKPTVQPTKRPNHNKPVVKAPAKVRGVKVKNLKGRKMKVSWSWDITDGYQIQYAMNRKFTKKKKTVTLNSWMSKKTFKHLKKKKTYYVRVRAFRKSGSVKKYGKWSAVKKIKIKK